MSRTKLDNILTMWERKAETEPGSYMASTLDRARRMHADVVELAEEMDQEEPGSGDRFLGLSAKHLAELYVGHHEPDQIRQMMSKVTIDTARNPPY